MRTLDKLGLLVVLASCHPNGPGPLNPVEDQPKPAPVEPVTPAPTPVPVAADPATKTDGDVTEAWFHGMQILVKRVPGAEQTATQLYILGGAQNWGKADAGIEQLAINVATTGGTERLGKDALAEKLADLGSRVDGGTSEDLSLIDSWSLRPAWDETFAILVDTFLHPAMPEAQIEIARAQQISALRHEQDDPDSKLGLLVHENIYRGHPYENRAVGTLVTVPSFNAAKLRAHLGKLRETGRLLLVVAGDVDPAHVIDAAKQAFGALPRGTFVAKDVPAWTATAGKVTAVTQKLPTNYIEAVFPGPTWKDPEIVVGMVAMNVLGLREFQEVRTKRNLSYAPSAFLNLRYPQAMGGLYVTAVDPIATMKVMLDEARRLRDELVPDKELAGAKSTLLTGIFVSSEALGDQARQLAIAQLHGGDWRIVRSLPDRVRAVTAAQVKAWAAAHLSRLQTFVIGDPTKLDRKALETF